MPLQSRRSSASTLTVVCERSLFPAQQRAASTAASTLVFTSSQEAPRHKGQPAPRLGHGAGPLQVSTEFLSACVMGTAQSGGPGIITGR